jgi:hypothetical protein
MESLLMEKVRQFTGSNVLWVVRDVTFRLPLSNAPIVHKDTPSTRSPVWNSA